MSKAREENQEQQQESEQRRDTKQANNVNQGSATKVATEPNSVRDPTITDANSRQHATPRFSGASVSVHSKGSLATKKRKKAAHRRRLRASSTNG